MLIDDITITIQAGHGGKGAVAFNKNAMSKGPTGGSGGKGGDIIFESTSDLSLLNQFRFKKELIAENGKDGRDQFRDGHDGKNLILKVPVGTIIHNLTTETERELVHVGEKMVAAQGGLGGKGNFQYRSGRNTTPLQSQPGLPGEAYELRLELKLIADIGLIGLPNVGKSSTLNMLTNSKSKVANYAFTTLEPNLGVYYDLILADIPGLIEGAADGKGLGIKFLRHIERTKILFHLIAADSASPENDYLTVRKELGIYNSTLLDKPEYIFISKADAVSPSKIKEITKTLARHNKNISAISLFDEESVQTLKNILSNIMRQAEQQAS